MLQPENQNDAARWQHTKHVPMSSVPTVIDTLLKVLLIRT